MTNSNKPSGYFKYVLACDCETTGLFYDCDNKAYNAQTGEHYQSIAWGFIVADAQTLEPVETLYLEIKWDGEALWDENAEEVHGLSKQYLKQNGITPLQASEQIEVLTKKYWKHYEPICLLGHNVYSFDSWFLNHLMESNGKKLRISGRSIDTFSLGKIALGAFNSSQLFEQLGLGNRGVHNALEDTEMALASAKQIKAMCQKTDDAVTHVITENVNPERVQEYEQWAKGGSSVVRQFAGFVSVDVIRPRDDKNIEYVIILKFDNDKNLSEFLNSKIYSDWLKKSHGLILSKNTQNKPQGLEVWFDLSKGRSRTVLQPAFYKLVIVATLAVYPLVLLSTNLLGPVTKDFPPMFSLLISVIAISTLMTYPVMPFLTRVLSFWLYPVDKSAG